MKILIVEDQPKLANAIKAGFKQEGWASDVEHDGPSGLAAAQGAEYDLIILDRMLPGGMDGAEICQKLREEGNMTPVLLLTAKGQVRDKVEGLNLGADDYLVKPFAFDELVARVRALWRRPKDAKTPVLTVADLTLDSAKSEVRRGGQAINLSQTEFALLEYLMHNAGQVLSKDQLINHVWEFDDDILPNTVEVFIRNLRQKIDKPFKNKLIKTVRGFGYKIDG